MTPARATDIKKYSNEPSSRMVAAQIVASPAAGPLTLSPDLLIRVTKMPPITPAISPLKTGALEANEMPRHNGSATKNTVMLDRKS